MTSKDEESALIDGWIKNPETIETRDIAKECMEILDSEIAGIKTQLEVARIEAGMSPLPPDRQDWVRRAAYALAMREKDRGAVWRRDMELRKIKGLARTAKKDPAVGLAKQARMQAEAEGRREQARVKHTANSLAFAAIAERRAFATIFVEVAKERVDTVEFAAMVAEAVKRRKSARIHADPPTAFTLELDTMLASAA